jgi:hypothetical protein
MEEGKGVQQKGMKERRKRVRQYSREEEYKRGKGGGSTIEKRNIREEERGEVQ